MSKAKNSMETLIELATEARDEAARLLATERANSDATRRQLQTLEQYRNEYTQQLHEAMARGLDLASLQNYQDFLASLDRAIQGAHDSLRQQEKKVSHCHESWRQEQRRLSSYDILQSRRQEAENQKDRRREARDNDEMTANFVHRERLARASNDN